MKTLRTLLVLCIMLGFAVSVWSRIIIGIPVGAGYEFTNNIGIGLRVIPGILTVSKTESDTDHNLVIALRATYTFKRK